MPAFLGNLTVPKSYNLSGLVQGLLLPASAGRDFPVCASPAALAGSGVCCPHPSDGNSHLLHLSYLGNHCRGSRWSSTQHRELSTGSLEDVAEASQRLQTNFDHCGLMEIFGYK